jgi:hypothetical protein
LNLWQFLYPWLVYLWWIYWKIKKI